MSEIPTKVCPFLMFAHPSAPRYQDGCIEKNCMAYEIGGTCALIRRSELEGAIDRGRLLVKVV